MRFKSRALSGGDNPRVQAVILHEPKSELSAESIMHIQNAHPFSMAAALQASTESNWSKFHAPSMEGGIASFKSRLNAIWIVLWLTIRLRYMVTRAK